MKKTAIIAALSILYIGGVQASGKVETPITAHFYVPGYPDNIMMTMDNPAPVIVCQYDLPNITCSAPRPANGVVSTYLGYIYFFTPDKSRWCKYEYSISTQKQGAGTVYGIQHLNWGGSQNMNCYPCTGSDTCRIDY